MRKLKHREIEAKVMDSVPRRRVTVVCPMVKTALTKASHISDACT